MTQPSSAISATSSHVTLVGRMGASITERELPSGDTVATFTVVVDRPRVRRSAAPRAVSVDAVPCQAWRASVRSAVCRLEVGQLIEVEGTLRRRFWRSPAGLGSALEVDVSRITAVR